jgi:hypothetical protein
MTSGVGRWPGHADGCFVVRDPLTRSSPPARCLPGGFLDDGPASGAHPGHIRAIISVTSLPGVANLPASRTITFYPYVWIEGSEGKGVMLKNLPGGTA